MTFWKHLKERIVDFATGTNLPTRKPMENTKYIGPFGIERPRYTTVDMVTDLIMDISSPDRSDNIEPITTVHPGRILYDFYMEPNGITIGIAAKVLKISRPNLSAIINGRAGISARMALRLAEELDTTPQYWLNLQNNYDLWKARHENG